MDDRDIARLGASSLFSGVDVLELAGFLANSPWSVREYAAKTVVLLAGCAYDELRIVLDGEAEAEMAGAGGRSTIVESFAPQEAIATAVLFSPDPILPVTVLARSDLRVACLPRKTLLSLAAAFPPVLEALLSDMGGRLALLADKYRALSFETLRERLADWLLRRAGRYPEAGGPGGDGYQLSGLAVRLPESKERLSAAFGVARPSLSREFAWLEDHGLIEMRGRVIRIVDEGGMEALRAGRKGS